MIDAEKLLGSLLKQGLKSGRRSRRRNRRRNRGSGLGGMVGGASLGMGVLGIAIAAFEHFSQKKSSGTTPQGVMTPPAPGAQPPPPPVPSATTPPPPPPPSAVKIQPSEAEVLIHAMVAAANADGEIDEAELAGIRNRMTDAGLSSDERADLERRLNNPPSLEEILKLVENPRLGTQVYAVTLAAIVVDTPAEQEYLRKLREGLGLPPEVIKHLHNEFDLDD